MPSVPRDEDSHETDQMDTFGGWLLKPPLRTTLPIVLRGVRQCAETGITQLKGYFCVVVRRIVHTDVEVVMYLLTLYSFEIRIMILRRMLKCTLKVDLAHP